MQTLATLPIAEGLFEGTGTQTRLLGTRCASCGTTYFPKALSCRNPQCRDKQIDDVAFGQLGTLYSYTFQQYRPPALFRMDSWAPYVLGLIDLPEGLRVLGMLTGCPVDEIRIGMAVELTAQALYHDEEGRAVLTYQYQPAKAAGGAS